MMVIFVSQCEKNALKKTRRVLDSFADRIGDNTWQTIITAEGLEAVKKLLRKSASKSTAVSCHWIRSRSRSELLWIVGSKEKFNDRGVVPVHRTQKSILKEYYENDWKYLPLIKALSAVAALFHDWGKATKLFQEKLDPTTKKKYLGDPIRHEWVSALLLSTFVKLNHSHDDQLWLEQLSQGQIDEKKILKELAKVEERPLESVPPIAQLVLWLIISHHRLPSFATDANSIKDKRGDKIAKTPHEALRFITQAWGYENRYDEKEYQKRLKGCFAFPKGLLSDSSSWMKEVKKWSSRLLSVVPLGTQSLENGSYRAVLHHARLSLMLGDHHYSSQNADNRWSDAIGLFANTDSKTKELKQKLDEHLVGVMKQALNITHLLPAFEKEPPRTSDLGILKKVGNTQFAWQDKAVLKIRAEVRDKEHYGFFAVNMASTGRGKTFANAKIMQSVAEDAKSMRYILALGLRTLTLQTGDEYRERIGLDETELAVLIGSKAIMQLHTQKDTSKSTKEELGSESLESLLDEEVDYDCSIPEEGLVTLLSSQKEKKFLYAPVLVCTIDHLMGAVETKRGGKYILPSLRLMSSDLVIDEIDDFNGSDLIAIGRLVYLAAMLGRKVMISSATIPPDLAEGFYNVYQKGWQVYTASRETKNEINCAWIDEFSTHTHKVDTVVEYRELHHTFVDKRVKHLHTQLAKRKGEIIPCPLNDDQSTQTKEERYFETIKETIVRKHLQHHTIDSVTQKQVSFGVVRMANISPCVALMKYLLEASYPEDIDVRVMAYHSQQVLLMRHLQEKHLDSVLKRKEKDGEQPIALANSLIREHLESVSVKNMIFILVATPVEEVGRDHDFDWAVVEPSSYRSIIQLAGRVRRHRESSVERPNIALMQYNFKAFKESDQSNKCYFLHPGYEESVQMAMNTHDMEKIIDVQQIKERLDATPRIQKPLNLNPKGSLADLEHFSLQKDLTNYERTGANGLQGYLDEAWFLTAHPQYLHPFRKSEPTIKLFLTYDPQKDRCYFAEIDEHGDAVDREEILGITRSILSNQSKLWMRRDYYQSLSEQSHMRDKTRREVSLLFGELGFMHYDGAKYEYNDQFGLTKL